MSHTTTPRSGRSDYQAFILNGIPAGGLFTGAEVPKTAEQQAIWGGTTGPRTTPVTTWRATRSPTTTTTRSSVNSEAIAFAV